MQARAAFISLLKRRVECGVIIGGRPEFSALDEIESTAKVALDEFKKHIQHLDPQAQDIISKLFLRNTILLHVTSGLDVERAKKINEVTKTVMDKILTPKPNLKVIK